MTGAVSFTMLQIKRGIACGRSTFFFRRIGKWGAVGRVIAYGTTCQLFKRLLASSIEMEAALAMTSIGTPCSLRLLTMRLVALASPIETPSALPMEIPFASPEASPSLYFSMRFSSYYI